MKLTFNANDVPPAEPNVLLERGYYVGEIVGSESAGVLGVKLTFRLSSPVASTLVDFFDPDLPDNAARLSSVCRAAGVTVMTDTEQLHGIPMRVYVDRRSYPQVGIAPYNIVAFAEQYPGGDCVCCQAPKGPPGAAFAGDVADELHRQLSEALRRIADSACVVPRAAKDYARRA
jgi:hypothetical protein